MPESTQHEYTRHLDMGRVEELILLYHEAPFWVRWWLRRRTLQLIDSLREMYDREDKAIEAVISRLYAATGQSEL